ncbi:hypothetical protein ACFJGW_15005 [Burkholderiaceae bacterium UC74_6]
MNKALQALRARLAQPRTCFLARSEDFADWCAQHRGEPCRLVVSSRLLQDFTFEPGLPLPDAAARDAYAHQQFGHYFGAAARHWAVATWEGGASALAGVDLAALRETARDARVVLRSVTPGWAPVLRRLCAEEPEWATALDAQLAWVEGAHLLWLRLKQGRLAALRSQRLESPTRAALQAALLTRAGSRVLVLGHGLDEATLPAMAGVRQIGRLDGIEPDVGFFGEIPPTAAQVPAPDFLGTRTPRHALAWPLAAVGALVLATTAPAAWIQHGERDAARAELARVQTQLRPQAVAARPVNRDVGMNRALEVQAQIDAPWSTLLAEVERAGLQGRERIDWLGLEYTSARGQLRLSGLAPQQGEALRLVDHLAAQAGWSHVVLGRFEAGAPGIPGLRFELSAQFDGRLQEGVAHP